MDDRTIRQVQTENIPRDLKRLDHWVMWKWVPKKGRPGKPGKAPCNTQGITVGVDNEAYHLSFEQALETYSNAPELFAGIGIVIVPGMVGIDLDRVRNADGSWNMDAQLVLAAVDSYCEVSPSGEGVKFLAYGKLNDKLANYCGHRGVEMYDGAKTTRFFTITGAVVDDHYEMGHAQRSIENIQAAITDPVTPLEYDEAEPDAFQDEARQLVEWVSDTQLDEYGTWVHVGMILHYVFQGDEEGLQLWDQVSRKNGKYEEGECHKKWESFTTTKPRLLTISTLRWLAKQNGFRDDKYTTGSKPASEFCKEELHRNYVVEDFLADNEPMVIGGPTKALKTTIALDMAVSIATGTPFLGKFNVPEMRRVMFISGESGETTTQENLKLVAKSKGLPVSALSQIHIGFKLPKLNNPHCVDDLLRELRDKDIKIVIIDPLYRSLNVGNEASNLYSMGEKLDLIAEKLHRAGVLCVLLHHFRKQGKFAPSNEAPELEDLSQSGIAEFGRQFLLLKRRASYKYDGKHALWFVWGGSAGHQGMRIIQADTGTRTEGARWSSELLYEDEWKERHGEESRARQQADYDALIKAVVDNPGVTVKELNDMGACEGGLGSLRSRLKELVNAEMLYTETGPRNVQMFYANLDPEEEN